MSTRLHVDPARPDPRAIQAAADVVLAGGVIVFPTDTLYGLAADPFNAGAVGRVFAAKGRPEEKALPLVAADLRQVEAFVGALPTEARRLAERFWPGPLTLIVPAPGVFADAVTGGLGTVAVRVPDHAVARALCHACGRPLIATSANVSGEPPTANPDEAAGMLHEPIGLMLDAGHTPGGPSSTIVDVTGPRPRLLRAGAVDWEAISAWLETR